MVKFAGIYCIMCPQVPNFDSASNNAVCMPLPWKYDSSMVTFWKEGQTGYPWIDAAMRQLRKEGWIHNYLRYTCSNISCVTFMQRDTPVEKVCCCS